MAESLARYWWLILLRGVLAVIFGAMALVWPGVTLFALLVLFGAFALIDGVFALVAAVGPLAAGRRVWLTLHGVAGIAIAIITFAWPGVTAIVLLALIAAWAMVIGVMQVVAAVRLRREVRGEWLLGLGGILSVAVGIALLVWPASGAVALVLLIGAYAAVYGFGLVGLGLRLRRLGSGSMPTRAAGATI
jgi:uncharacterized membrane protein HdeD (DUF308 family)